MWGGLGIIRHGLQQAVVAAWGGLRIRLQQAAVAVWAVVRAGKEGPEGLNYALTMFIAAAVLILAIVTTVIVTVEGEMGVANVLVNFLILRGRPGSWIWPWVALYRGGIREYT